MTAHPYPQKVVEAVAKGLFDHEAERKGILDTWAYTWEFVKENYRRLAGVSLQALWEASRVVDVDQLPDDAVYLNDLGGIGFVGADRNTHMVDHMEHILHWGDEL